MKICIYGAGAIGGLIAVRLIASGQPVSVIARKGAATHLRNNGIELKEGSTRHSYPVNAVSDPTELGVQDLIVISVKQPSVNTIVRKLKPIMDKRTRVLLAMNGVPWWFFDGLSESPKDILLKTVDPDGDLRKFLPSHQIISCVVHLSASSESPGFICLNKGNKLVVGEPYGDINPSTRLVETLLSEAGFDVSVSEKNQRDIWFKLWGNITLNPISALTNSTTDQLLDDPLVSQFCCRIMTEVASVGERIGCHISETPSSRLDVTRMLGKFKTSMLQDVEASRSLEYEGLVGAVYEIAQKTGTDVPNIEALYGLIRQLDRSLSNCLS